MMKSLPLATPPSSNWSAVGSMSMCVALLIASEFMPVSLLTPIAHDLGATEGLAGQAISVSGCVAVLTSLLITGVAGSFDRRRLLCALTATMLLSLVLIALAPNFGLLMLARALLGVTIGGFWSLSTATLVQLVPAESMPRALSVLYLGNAAATAFAAPIGSFAGALVGWRGVFWGLVPLAAAALLWQWRALPSAATRQSQAQAQAQGQVLSLLRRAPVRRAVAGVMLAFGGAFTAFTYFRPFLERHGHADAAQLSLLLLALGVAGFPGTWAAGAQVQRHGEALLRLLPLALGLVTLALPWVGAAHWALALLLFAWGLLNAALPVAWFHWLTHGIADAPEAGGGLMVAAIQLSILLGAGVGGLLLDHVGVTAPLFGGAALLAAAAVSLGDGRRLRGACLPSTRCAAEPPAP
ncbi:MFS transporter [Rubrivivax gelatinosus]|uniref:Transcriptional regulator n=1 Tax=Rubrivivax gelatinosus TaxID=28068 RepID=A0A4R2MM01_RUBGE|nr:MFS transporter [Rubrivivax gelatinosus]TCP04056.1 transcriptional regulator [Rubrivivax gelatinosus]